MSGNFVLTGMSGNCQGILIYVREFLWKMAMPISAFAFHCAGPMGRQDHYYYITTQHMAWDHSIITTSWKQLMVVLRLWFVLMKQWSHFTAWTDGHSCPLLEPEWSHCQYSLLWFCIHGTCYKWWFACQLQKCISSSTFVITAASFHGWSNSELEISGLVAR